MWIPADSPAAVRFFGVLAEEGRLKTSARMAGVSKATARRWIRDRFVALRDDGLSVAETKQRLGFSSSLMDDWDAARSQRGDGRHHLRREADVEERFWELFDAGASVTSAARGAGVGRSSGYRWWQRRFEAHREAGVSVRTAAARLRLSPAQAAAWEAARRGRAQDARRAQQAAQVAAVHASAAHARARMAPRSRTAAEARAAAYWELMRQGYSNTAACRLLGVTRHTGQRIRRRAAHQTTTEQAEAAWSGRYLSLPERLVIADLLRLGSSLRAIAAELGRAPSTVKREVDRHRDAQGRYLPRAAEAAAAAARRRPRTSRLAADARLRRLVQRKLNRYWSPQQIAGWLRATHPDDPGRWVCAETIYQALIVPGAQVLAQRYTARLRTGRRLRRSRYLTRANQDGPVRDMTMIDARPTEVTDRTRAGDWEGDLIIGAGSTSAMITLRERVTHYGLVINLPVDHTAATVTTALVEAFAAIPAHLAKTLTWDQGAEMARHLDFTAATGIPVFFAERSSPWQRGANENYNGLVRQYYPKNTDLSVHPTEHVDAVVTELNTRPRKSLNYQTPDFRFRQAARAA